MYRPENNMYRITFARTDGRTRSIDKDAPDILAAAMRALDECPEEYRVYSIIKKDQGMIEWPDKALIASIWERVNKNFAEIAAPDIVDFCRRYAQFMALASKEGTAENKWYSEAKTEGVTR
jgi:hypothetical protein